MNSDKTNALFIQRLLAFLIDMFLVTIVATVLSYGFCDVSGINKLNDNTNEIREKYLNHEIDTKTYVRETMDIDYEIARKTGIVSLISLVISVLYFVCYQFYNGGKTIGKSIMKIRVVSNDGRDLSFNNYIYRSLIIDYILFDIMLLSIIVFADKGGYFYGTLIVNIIKFVVILASIVMVMFRKDSRGLHDLVANTKVERIMKEKELEVCES